MRTVLSLFSFFCTGVGEVHWNFLGQVRGSLHCVHSCYEFLKGDKTNLSPLIYYFGQRSHLVAQADILSYPSACPLFYLQHHQSPRCSNKPQWSLPSILAHNLHSVSKSSAVSSPSLLKQRSSLNLHSHSINSSPHHLY